MASWHPPAACTPPPAQPTEPHAPGCRPRPWPTPSSPWTAWSPFLSLRSPIYPERSPKSPLLSLPQRWLRTLVPATTCGSFLLPLQNWSALWSLLSALISHLFLLLIECLNFKEVMLYMHFFIHYHWCSIAVSWSRYLVYVRMSD